MLNYYYYFCNFSVTKTKTKLPSTFIQPFCKLKLKDTRTELLAFTSVLYKCSVAKIFNHGCKNEVDHGES